MKEGLRSREKADENQIESDDTIPLICLVPRKKKKKNGKKRNEKKRAKLVFSDTDSDNDLIVSACKKGGRNSNGKRKRNAEVECSDETEICVLQIEPDQNEFKRSRLDVFEYNEDDLVDSFEELKKGSVSGVYKRKKRKTDISPERNLGDGLSDQDFEMKVGTFKEKSKLSRKSPVKVKDVKKQKLESSEQTSEPSDGEEDMRSKSVANSVGSRTRSAANLKKKLENSGSTEMREKHESPLSSSPDEKQRGLLRRVEKDTSLKPSLKSGGSKRSKEEASVKGKPSSKPEISSSTEIRKPRKANMEKELIREQIKSLVVSAGWTIEYRQRMSKLDYKDAVYVDPKGSAYWSCLKAYYALQKQCAKLEQGDKYFGTDFVFTPISDELLNRLTRLTKKKIEREKLKNPKAKIENKEGTSERKKPGRKPGKSLKARLKKNGFNQHRKQGIKRAVSSDDTDKIGNDMHNGTTKRKTQRGSPVSAHGSDKLDNDVHCGRPKGKRKGGYSLLVRDKEGNSGDNQFIPYPGKLSILSWLIDSQVLPLGGKVKFMNKKRTQAVLEGVVTRDGINCGCCSEIVTISEFETHAGSKANKSRQNLFAENGVPLIQCQIDAWNKQKESEHSGFYSIDVTTDDPNDDSCCICGDGGDLICCDGCPSTFHQNCLDIQVLPKGDWHCHNCRCKFCGLVRCIDGEGGEATTLESLTCGLCEEKYHESCAQQRNAVSADSDGPSAPFCGQNCKELFEQLQKFLGVKHELEAGFSWTVIQRCRLKSDTSLCGLPQKVACNSKLSLALSVMDECFLPTIDERSGINLMHNVVYNCGSNFIRLNYSGFYTFLLERDDEIISAATVRIRGARFAEMPFIGTRHIYRRQGMCRRLLNAIELCLGSLNLEKLIIPAISELADTWTNVFGFIPLEQSFRQEARYLNMVVFPGVALLQKLLLKHSSTEETITDGSAKDMGPMKDTYITAEQADNSDSRSVERDNHDSDGSVVSHANEMITEAVSAETDPQASCPLVQDTSDACNSLAQEEALCSDTQRNSVVEEKPSLKLSVEPDPQVPIKNVINGALEMDTQMDDVVGAVSNVQEVSRMIENGGPDLHSLGDTCAMTIDVHKSIKDVVNGALEVDRQRDDVESSGDDALEGAVSHVQEVSTMIENGVSKAHPLGEKTIAPHKPCLDLNSYEEDMDCCGSPSEDDSSRIANGRATSLPAGKERVSIYIDLEDGQEEPAKGNGCVLERSSKISDLKLLQKTENGCNISNGGAAEDPCELKMGIH